MIVAPIFLKKKEERKRKVPVKKKISKKIKKNENVPSLDILGTDDALNDFEFQEFLQLQNEMMKDQFLQTRKEDQEKQEKNKQQALLQHKNQLFKEQLEINRYKQAIEKERNRIEPKAQKSKIEIKNVNRAWASFDMAKNNTNESNNTKNESNLIKKPKEIAFFNQEKDEFSYKEMDLLDEILNAQSNDPFLNLHKWNKEEIELPQIEKPMIEKRPLSKVKKHENQGKVTIKEAKKEPEIQWEFNDKIRKKEIETRKPIETKEIKKKK